MKNKYLNFKIEDVIKANLDTQSVQRTLKNKFGLLKSSFDIVFNDKYLSYYKTWPEEKKKEFIATIGGKANFKKTKFFLENKRGALWK